MFKIAALSTTFAVALAMSPVLAHAAPLQLTTMKGKTATLHKIATGTPIKQDAKSTTYQFDDGSSEDAIAFGNGSSNVKSIWFDQFKTVAGGEAIKAVQIAWGTPADGSTKQEINGSYVVIGIWSDPNNDGDPSDAKLIGSVKAHMTQANKDKFITYTFDKPVYVGKAGTSFFAGDVTPAKSFAEIYFQGIDETNSAGHSWVAAQANGGKLNYHSIGANDTVGTIDSFGLPGNWLIRAIGVAGK